MKKARHILLSFFISVFSLSIYAQEDIDFIKDFDYLYKVLKENSISLSIYIKENNIDLDELYRNLKSDLEANPSFENFLDVSKQLFNISADKHHSFVHPSMYDFLVKGLPEHELKVLMNNVDSAFLGQSLKMYKLRNEIKNKDLNPIYNLPIMYHEGEYYFSHKCKIDKTIIPKKSKILKIDNSLVNDFINKNKTQWSLYYDISKKTFYPEHLFNSQISKRANVSLLLESPKNGKLVQVAINNKSVVNIDNEFALILGFKNKVKYFQKENILYIRYFSFDWEPPIEELKKYQIKKIDKLIVDVRGNSGGNDLQWIQLMNSILKNIKPIEKPLIIAKKGTISEKLSKQEDYVSELSDDSHSVYRNDILDYIKPTKEFLSTMDTAIQSFLYKEDLNLNYTGKIYCLTDQISFSASLSFASLKYYLDDFILIGNSSPYYGGFSSTPMLFMLPESKLVFRVTCNFDYKLYANEKRIIPDVIVSEPLEKKIKWRNKKIINYNSKFYTKKSVWFQEVLKN